MVHMKGGAGGHKWVQVYACLGLLTFTILVDNEPCLTGTWGLKAIQCRLARFDIGSVTMKWARNISLLSSSP